MKRSLIACFALVSTAVLTGCGGGGGDAGDAPPAAIDKYIGTWSNCFRDASSSAKEIDTFVKASATTANYTVVTDNYNSPDCTGVARTSETERGTMSLQGTKRIGTETVDQIIAADQTSGAVKQILVIRGNQLVFGESVDNGGTLDSNGYPTALDTHYILLKQ